MHAIFYHDNLIPDKMDDDFKTIKYFTQLNNASQGLMPLSKTTILLNITDMSEEIATLDIILSLFKK